MSEYEYITPDDVAVNKKYSITSQPTRQCLVCERLENPNALIVYTNNAWLCDKCKSVLQKLVESEGENEQREAKQRGKSK